VPATPVFAPGAFAGQPGHATGAGAAVQLALALGSGPQPKGGQCRPRESGNSEDMLSESSAGRSGRQTRRARRAPAAPAAPAAAAAASEAAPAAAAAAAEAPIAEGATDGGGTQPGSKEYKEVLELAKRSEEAINLALAGGAPAQSGAPSSG
jgi:pyruvate/2-oxoglutarate dehydrogenase complex dihydrolipoamide acyltransferase (E2) component